MFMPRGLHRAFSQGRHLAQTQRHVFSTSAVKDELAFAWITPKALAKSLEGAIMARLLSTPGLKLVGARMIDPSEALVDDYTTLHAEISQGMESGFDFHEAMNEFLSTELKGGQAAIDRVN